MCIVCVCVCGGGNMRIVCVLGGGGACVLCMCVKKNFRLCKRSGLLILFHAEQFNLIVCVCGVLM